MNFNENWKELGREEASRITHIVSNNVKALLKENNMSLRAFSRLYKEDAARFSALLNSDNLTLTSVCRLAVMLNVSINRLLEGI